MKGEAMTEIQQWIEMDQLLPVVVEYVSRHSVYKQSSYDQLPPRSEIKSNRKYKASGAIMLCA